MIDNLAIDLWCFGNFANKEDIKRKYNSMIDLLKFTSIKKILSGLEALDYNQVCGKTLSYKNIETFFF